MASAEARQVEVAASGTDRRPATAELVLGPILRYAGTESATFWVETSEACEVEVLGRRTATFAVEGHHFALLLVEDLEPASVASYDVRLDGRVVWPPDDGRPAPAVHTRNNERRVRLAFGSCRIGAPQPTSTEPPWTDELARTGIDALWAYSRQLQRGEVEWPDALMLLGDQVYADEVSPVTAEFIRARRDTSEPPGDEIADARGQGDRVERLASASAQAVLIEGAQRFYGDEGIALAHGPDLFFHVRQRRGVAANAGEGPHEQGGVGA